MRKLKVVLLQLGINDGESKIERLRRVGRMLDRFRGADLIMLPEMWNIGYFAFDRYREESEPLEGDTVAMLVAAAKRLGSYVLSGSFVERAQDGGLFNTCVLIGPDGEIKGCYRKIHLFGYGSLEKEILSAGEKVVVADTPFGKMGLSICYDLRFPELYRRLVDEGAIIMLNCSAWQRSRAEHWLLFSRVRAIENQCYFLACGCAGSSRGMAFAGHSQVVDPWGRVMACAGEGETVLQVEIYPEEVYRVRDEFPVLKDRVFF